MKSCLYECRVLHQRFAPRSHRFDYGMFYFCLDLDEIDEVVRLGPLVKRHRPILYSFRDEDFIDSTNNPCKEKLLQYVGSKTPGLAARIARIKLLTSLRVFGYIFNPVSIYYCLDANERLLCAVAEVTNTFRESKLYLIVDPSASVADDSEGFAYDTVLKAEMKKMFYVSPFTDLESLFQFVIRDPRADLSLTINTVEGANVVLASSVTGSRVSLTTWQLARLTICYPLVSLRTITLIHWQALKLFLKRVPFKAKEHAPHLQTNLRNPHKSLSQAGVVLERSTFLGTGGSAEIDKTIL
jgi:DUF1365 family protein